MTVVDSYVGRLRTLAQMGYLEAWYSRTDVEQIVASISGVQRKRTEAVLSKARSKDHLHAQAKLTEVVDGRRRINAVMPLLQRVSFDTSWSTTTSSTWR